MGETQDILQKSYLDEDVSILKRAFKSLVELLVGRKAIEESSFKVLPTGEWLGLFSNNFKDRQDEIFALSAIDQYISKVKSGDFEYPTLMFWHIPGTEIQGKANEIGRVGHFVWVKGTFSDSEFGQKFREYYKSHGPWKMSHGFTYNPLAKIDGVYYEFRTYEVSVLPPWAAANPYTTFSGGVKMKVTQEQRSALVAALGQELGDQFADQAEKAGEELAEVVASKSSSEPPSDLPDAVKMMEGLVESQKSLSESISQLAASLAPVVEGQKTLTTQVAGFEARLKGVEDLLSLETSASKSSRTQADPATDPELALLETENKLAGRKSVVEMAISGHIDPTKLGTASLFEE